MLMTRPVGAKQARLDIQKLINDWKIDLKDYISDNKLRKAIPKPIVIAAQELVNLGWHELIWTILTKKPN
jgi:hypothetical protein